LPPIPIIWANSRGVMPHFQVVFTHRNAFDD